MARVYERVQKEKDLAQDEAQRDPLTGTLNRRGLENRAETEEHGSALVLDLDKFKQINDKFGHKVGDAVLQNFANVVRSTLRVSDPIFARLGGEEFIVLLKEDAKAALCVAERIREAVQTITINNHPDLKVTVSIGIATDALTRRTGDVLGELVRRADDALYKAKNSGRNRVVHADDTQQR